MDQKGNAQAPQDSSSVDVEKLVDGLKSKTVSATLGWAVALILAVAVGYNTLYVKISTLLDKSGEIDKLTERVEYLEQKKAPQKVKTIQNHTLLKDFTGEKNVYSGHFILVSNIDVCDSISVAANYLEKLQKKNDCNGQ